MHKVSYRDHNWLILKLNNENVRSHLRADFVDIEVQEVGGFWTMWFLKLNCQTARLVRGPSHLRSVIRLLLVPFWIMDQFFAPLFDRHGRSPQETAGYLAVARKE